MLRCSVLSSFRKYTVRLRRSGHPRSRTVREVSLVKLRSGMGSPTLVDVREATGPEGGRRSANVHDKGDESLRKEGGHKREVLRGVPVEEVERQNR